MNCAEHITNGNPLYIPNGVMNIFRIRDFLNISINS